MKKLSIVIVSYNVADYLVQCLASVSRAIKNVDADVWIVDNNSKDETIALVEKMFPDANIIASSHNLGFAKANNKAITDSDSQYVLLLNPDTIVGEEVIKDTVDFMDKHPDAGALGVRMLQADGNDARESRRGIPDPLTSFFKVTGLCKRFPENHRLGHYYMGWLPWDKTCRIEVVSGAFCMLRRKAIEQVGSLDEDFFMYGEDIDLSYRILKGGWNNYYLPSLILHYKGESTTKTSFRYLHVFYGSMLIFIRKHYPNMGLLISLPVKAAILFMAFLSLVRMTARAISKSLGFFRPAKVASSNDYILFDASQTTYSEMLRNLQGSDHKKKIAVYYHDLQKVITPDDVFNHVKRREDFSRI